VGEPSVAPEPGVAGLTKARTRYVLLPQDPARAAELARACGLSPVLGQVLLNRGLHAEQAVQRFLAPKLADLTSPASMIDRAAAAERLARAIRQRERIVVFGDYDVDGTTSTAILADILEALGGDVRAMVASRFEGGYGLSDRALERVMALEPRVLVTCDCGSSDHARVARARAAGVDVLVVDHHLVPTEPLPALAFLNPHRPDCGFPFKGLCSAGLALSVGAAVRAELGATLDLRGFLDLVALGTIADVAPLAQDNRALVRAGLAQLSSDRARPGVVALREAARIRPGTPLSAVDVAFRLAPRLNAAGRLADPQLTLDLLRSRSLEEARGVAAQIERINEERKSVERGVTEAALAQLEADAAPRHGLLAASTAFHRGVVGISAARLVDRFSRPVLVVAVEGEHGHGSGRAPDGFPLYAAIASCRDLLEKFGGHDAAAGLTVHVSHIAALREAFDEACKKLSNEGAAPIVRDVNVDARIGEGAYGLPRATELFQLEPQGEGNPEPLFEIRGERVRADVVAGAHLKLGLRVGGRDVSAFGFELAERYATLGTRLRLVGQLRPDTYRGGDAIEARIVHLEDV
jgi:single-stranded-DNA-specific exonuclease